MTFARLEWSNQQNQGINPNKSSDIDKTRKDIQQRLDDYSEKLMEY